METRIPYLKGQISTKRSYLQNCYQQDAEYRLAYDDCLTNIGRLEKELDDLLLYKRKALVEFQHLETLISGDASPMGKIQFFQPGLLESIFFEKIQIKLIDQRREQKNALAAIRDDIQELKRKESEIEDEIGVERTKLMNIDDLISRNKANIESRKMEIAVIESQIRSLA